MENVLPKWKVVKDPGQDVIHILPMRDLGSHTESESCLCEPQREIVEGGSRDLLIHDLLWDADDETLARA